MTTIPAGWYQDPETPSQDRYWDGNAWTNNTQPSSDTQGEQRGRWRDDIQAAADRMPSTFTYKRDLNHLASELWEGETVDQIVGGSYGNGSGLLVLTDRRLLFFHKGLASATSEDFPLDQISSVEFKSGIALAQITVYASNQKATVKNLDKNAAKAIADTIRARISRGARQAPAAAPAPAVSAADQLLKLKALHDAGVLTEAEYQAKSAPLIAQL